MEMNLVKLDKFRYILFLHSIYIIGRLGSKHKHIMMHINSSWYYIININQRLYSILKQNWMNTTVVWIKKMVNKYVDHRP